MARLARVVVPGCPHHVTQRGNRGQQTFFDDEDCAEYIDLMAQFCAKAGTEVWAYCLMPNHVHLVMVPTDPDGLRAAIGEAHRRYTRKINARQDWRGHLWQERFHSFPIEREEYLATAVRYIENNPVRAGLCRRAHAWRWSSAAAHRKGKDDELVRVAPMRERIVDWGAYLREDEEEGLADKIHAHMRTGRPLGSEAFLRTVEKQLGRRLRPRKPGPKPRRDVGTPAQASRTRRR